MISTLAFHIFISESKQLNTFNNKSSLHKFAIRFRAVGNIPIFLKGKSNKGWLLN